jgi:hypothetical protein
MFQLEFYSYCVRKDYTGLHSASVSNLSAKGKRTMNSRITLSLVAARLLLVSAVIGLLLSAVYAQDDEVKVTSFTIGTGYADVIPRQIVRTADDRVYVFAGMVQYTTDIVAYWTQTPGLPEDGAFTGEAVTSVDSDPFSVDAVYDAGTLVHLLVNTRGGKLYDIPFDVTSNSYQSPITLATDMASLEGDYLGTSGVSGLFDRDHMLHIVYWSSGNHITYVSVTYDQPTNTITQVTTPTQLDTEGSANHPVLAISPLDGTVTVAWVSEATSPARILTRTRDSAGNWDAEAVISTAPVWISTSGGLNIDQGPSLIIGTDGTRHLAYIQDFDDSGDYGVVHYVSKARGGDWVDETLNTRSHDPAVALTDTDAVYILGHGPHEDNQNTNMYYSKRQPDGSWTPIQLVATSDQMDYDSSPSVKWGVIGFNRPEVIEFVFFATDEGNYNNPRVVYGRLEPQGSS